MAGTRVALKDLNLTPYISTGSAVAYNISVERITAYSDKETFFIDFHTTCGDAPTLNINGLGDKNIVIGGVNLVTGQLLPDSGYFIKYSSSLDKFVLVGGGGGGTMNCGDVKNCIENFTDLDLSNLDELILGGPSTDIYINGSTIHYDSVTENWDGDSEINLEEGASITNNLDGTVNNNYGDTYEENNVYEDGSIFNHTGDIINNYEDYTENNDYGDNVEINNNYSSDTVINHNGGIHNYSSDTQVNFEGDTNIENLEVTNLTLTGGGNVMVSGTWEEDTFDSTIPTGDTCVLTETPISANAIFVFKKDSGLVWFQTVDYTYDSGTNTVTLVTPLTTGEAVLIKYMRVTSAGISGIIPIVMSTNIHDAIDGEYIVVTYSAGNSTINLPDPSTNNGAVIKIKKLTGEDVRVVTILPYGAELIDGYTGATMNINRTMYTFTCIDGNWYLGD